MMSLRVACFLFALAVASAQAPARSLRLRNVKTPNSDNTGAWLQMLCTFDKSIANFNSVTKMKLFQADLGLLEAPVFIAEVNNTGVFATHLENVNVEGALTDEKDRKASLDVSWEDLNDGFCQSYTCVTIGELMDNQQSIMTKTIKVRSSNGQGCNKPGEQQPSTDALEDKLKECDVGSEEIQANAASIEQLKGKLSQLSVAKEAVQKLSEEFQALFEDVQKLSKAPRTIQDNANKLADLVEKVEDLSTATDEEAQSAATKFAEIQEDLTEVENGQGQGEEILRKVLSIDRSQFYVSDLYKNQIYIASKSTHDFNLHDTNEVCKENGGYLVEFDDEDEQNFVKNFAKEHGGYTYFTGANDVDSEGDFVYYNSKKPVTNLEWKSGEPNNDKGNEDCVEFQQSGFNDLKCDNSVRFLCEIPLF